MNNALTKTEAQAVEMCHHGLRGLSVKDAAEQMGVRPHTVRKHLRNAETKAPNLFPILTTTQAEILHTYTVEGCTVAQIALMRGISQNTVREHLRKLRNKGVLKEMKPSRPISFDESSMSDKVVAKW